MTLLPLIATVRPLVFPAADAGSPNTCNERGEAYVIGTSLSDFVELICYLQVQMTRKTMSSHKAPLNFQGFDMFANRARGPSSIWFIEGQPAPRMLTFSSHH